MPDEIKSWSVSRRKTFRSAIRTTQLALGWTDIQMSIFLACSPSFVSELKNYEPGNEYPADADTILITQKLMQLKRWVTDGFALYKTIGDLTGALPDKMVTSRDRQMWGQRLPHIEPQEEPEVEAAPEPKVIEVEAEVVDEEDVVEEPDHDTIRLEGWELALVGDDRGLIMDTTLGKRLGYGQPRFFRRVIKENLDEIEEIDGFVCVRAVAARTQMPTGGIRETVVNAYFLTPYQAMAAALLSGKPKAKKLRVGLVKLCRAWYEGRLKDSAADSKFDKYLENQERVMGTLEKVVTTMAGVVEVMVNQSRAAQQPDPKKQEAEEAVEQSNKQIIEQVKEAVLGDSMQQWLDQNHLKLNSDGSIINRLGVKFLTFHEMEQIIVQDVDRTDIPLSLRIDLGHLREWKAAGRFHLEANWFAWIVKMAVRDPLRCVDNTGLGKHGKVYTNRYSFHHMQLVVRALSFHCKLGSPTFNRLRRKIGNKDVYIYYPNLTDALSKILAMPLPKPLSNLQAQAIVNEFCAAYPLPGEQVADPHSTSN